MSDQRISKAGGYVSVEGYDRLRSYLAEAIGRAASAEAAAEEARREVERVRRMWEETAKADAADLAEARQERERFETLALTNARAADRNAARIQTLEAALRYVVATSEDPDVTNHRRAVREAHRLIDPAALQPTTDHEEALD